MIVRAFAVTASLLFLAPSVPRAYEVGILALEVRGERLTLRTTDAPLVTVLEHVAKAAQIVVHCEEPSEERVSVDFTNVSIEEGLQRLLLQRNTLVVYDQRSQKPAAVYVFGPRTDRRTGTPLAAAGSAGEDEVESAAELWKTALRVQDIEDDLRAVSTIESPGVSAFLQHLQADPESAVRIAALHWLVGRKDLAVTALTTAFRDSDPTVQSAAMQILLERGSSDQSVAAVMAAAQGEDEAPLRQTLINLFAQEDSGVSAVPSEAE
jgi:HEAT repeats